MASAKEIPPGGEGKIDVTFKVGTRGGTRKKTITVTTNDPEQKRIKLKVSADVQVILTTKPNRINFGRLRKGTKSEPKYVSLIGTDKNTVKITSIKSKNKFLEVETNPAGYEKDLGKQIKVSVLSGMNVGRFRERIIIHTDHEKVKQLTLYAYGEVVGNIMVKPNYLSFGILKEGKSPEKTIILKSTSDSLFKVLDVKSTIPELETELEIVQEGQEYKVKARVKEVFDNPLLRGKVIITTDDPEQENIEVKVFARTLQKPMKSRPQEKSEKDEKKSPVAGK